MSQLAEQLWGAAEIVPQRLYFQCLELGALGGAGLAGATAPPGTLCYLLDADLIYEPFCADFGPCNLAHSWRFCQRVNQLLEQAGPTQRLYLLVGSHPHKRSNAAALVGIYSVLFQGMTPEQAYAPLRPMEPFVGFRDASCGVPTYQLPVHQAIAGMYRAKEVGFINWHKGEVLDVMEYEHYEQVENGDLNWIIPGKFMAFSGPSAQPKHFGGWRTYMPEDYIDYFRDHGVKAVVRLNKRMYESARFTDHGVRHHELYFPDGTCPSEAILARFLELAEREPGAMAVHCKAGLGRTGVLICSYMIKHYGFSAEEAMGYIRVCRPGSVIGPQQNYLLQWAPLLRRVGEQERAAAAAAAAAAVSAPGKEAGVRRPTFTLSADATAAAQANPAPRAPSQARQQPPPSPSRRPSSAARQQQEQRAAAAEAQLRRSPRNAREAAAAADQARAVPPSLQISQLDIRDDDYKVSVPATTPRPASPSKPPAPARVHIHVSANASQLPPRPPQQQQKSGVAPLGERCGPSPAGTPQKGALEAGAQTPPALSPGARVPPPSSSSKRMLAPNGQPRKIPMAMDFDQVAPADLEDRDAGDDAWTVGSRPSRDNYQSASRVGAFAAAAGRGASAFVEAFRSAMGTHRTSYSRRTSGGGQ